MKFSTALLTIAFSSVPICSSLSFLGSDQAVLDSNTDLSVPGDNPLVYCQDPSDYILAIERVDLDPNPPHPGKNLTVKASGTFSQDVDEGATVHLQVKWNLVTLINQEADLCEQIKNVDLDCPLKKGDTNITKVIELPQQIPPGTYSVLADVYTKDKEQITCLKATVKF